MTTPEDKRLAATKLMAQIQSSLSDVMTPQRARALMDLKSMSLEETALKALVSPTAMQSWLSGSSPIMPSRQLNRLELVLGFERGALVADRVHVFRIDESALGKDACAKHFQEILPLFKRGVMSVVCDDAGRDTWAESSRVHVLAMAQGGYAILSHISKSKLISSPVSQQLESIAWADHGTRGSDRSDLVVHAGLAKQLNNALPKENDQLALELAEHFARAAQLKAEGGIRTLKPRR